MKGSQTRMRDVGIDTAVYFWIYRHNWSFTMLDTLEDGAEQVVPWQTCPSNGLPFPSALISTKILGAKVPRTAWNTWRA